MVQPLIRYCLRDGDPTFPEVRTRCGTLAGRVGICANVFLFALKLLCGLFAGSVSMVADAVNNLCDAAGSLVTLIGFKLAGQAADADHPFGHGRMEYISGFLVSVAILLMGFELLKSSVQALFAPAHTTFSPMIAMLLLLAIGVKLMLWQFNRKLGKLIDSAAMEATAADSLSDCAATGAVLLSSFAGQFTDLPVDAAAGILVSLFIFKAGWDSLKATIDPLLGRPMDPELAKEIDELVVSHEFILGIHDLVYHDYGPGRAMMSFHAEVPAEGDMLVIHDMIDHIERELKAKHHIEAVIHMDPVVMDERTIALRDQIEELAKTIDPSLSIHDFRITAGPLHTNLLFDLLIPYQCPLPPDVVRACLTQEIKNLSDRYFPVFHIDRSFVE
jgi:cation diffusion facilitator family transporter